MMASRPQGECSGRGMYSLLFSEWDVIRVDGG